MQKTKIIFDTNVFLSAFLFPGRLSGIEKKIAHQYILCFSEPLIAEVLRIFKRFNAPQKVYEHFRDLVSLSEMYFPVSKANICRDEKDNFLLDLCRCANAKYLATGDKDLLVLKEYEGTIIMNPKEFLALGKDIS